jgi:hypothetical protein
MEDYNCDERAATCEKDGIYKIVFNDNPNNKEYYNTDRMIKIINVTEAFVPEQGDTTSAIVPKSYQAKDKPDSVSLGFSQDDLVEGRLILNKCTLLEKESRSSKRSRPSLPAPAAGGKRTKKTIRRKRKGRKRRTTKRNKRQ